MSGWLDLIGIGIDIAQSNQIYKAREQLNQLQSGAQEEAVRKFILETMRNFIFEIAQDIKALEERMDIAPQQVYIVARALEWRLQDTGISPDLFPDFADKEYVQQTFTRIQKAMRQSRDRLSVEQVTQADTAINYAIEASLLNKTIEAKLALEELYSTEPEWRQLSSEASSADSRKTTGCLVLFLTLAVLPAGLALVIAIVYDISEFLASIVGFVGFCLWVLALVWNIKLFGKGKPAQYEQVKAHREELQKKLLPKEEWDQAVRLWGNLSSQGYQEMQATRTRFLQNMLGQVEGFEKFLPVEN